MENRFVSVPGGCQLQVRNYSRGGKESIILSCCWYGSDINGGAVGQPLYYGLPTSFLFLLHLPFNPLPFSFWSFYCPSFLSFSTYHSTHYPFLSGLSIVLLSYSFFSYLLIHYPLLSGVCIVLLSYSFFTYLSIHYPLLSFLCIVPLSYSFFTYHSIHYPFLSGLSISFFLIPPSLTSQSDYPLCSGLCIVLISCS
jgi:hypothetical protein